MKFTGLHDRYLLLVRNVSENNCYGTNIFLFLRLIIRIMLLHRKKALVKHLEDEDVDAFTEEVKNFDQVSRLDQWYTTILLRIKKQIPDDGELC